MTHSQHRQGSYSSLANDFVVLGFPGRQFDDLPTLLEQFKQIGSRYNPVNIAATQSPHHLVYDSKEKVSNLLKDLVKADLGLSITVTGLRDQVTECCNAVGITPHTVNQSLGFWGRTEKLPPVHILEITTMCGHGRISPNLVLDLATKVQKRKLNIHEAIERINQLCLCTIFNQNRALEIMESLVADIDVGNYTQPQPPSASNESLKKESGITIDPDRCTGCMECIPYCYASAIGMHDATDTATILPDRCTECGVCMQSRVCPEDAFIARDLTWPRTLRGKYQSLHSPYRAAPVQAEISHPLDYTHEGRIFPIPNHAELTNDVEGFCHHGEAVVEIEMGRPHVGTSFRDIKKVVQSLDGNGLKIDMGKPVTDVASAVTAMPSWNDILSKQEVLDEKTGWVVLKLSISENEVPLAVNTLRQVESEIDTVFALNILSRVAKDESTVADRVSQETGIKPAINCKTNMGLGRPLAVD